MAKLQRVEFTGEHSGLERITTPFGTAEVGQELLVPIDVAARYAAPRIVDSGKGPHDVIDWKKVGKPIDEDGEAVAALAEEIGQRSFDQPESLIPLAHESDPRGLTAEEEHARTATVPHEIRAAAVTAGAGEEASVDEPAAPGEQEVS